MSAVAASSVPPIWSIASSSSTFQYTSNFAWSPPPKCISNLTQSHPPSAFFNSYVHVLQVYHQTCLFTDCELIFSVYTIFKLAWLGPTSASSQRKSSRALSASQHLVDHDLSVDLVTYLITGANCVTKLTPLQPPNASHSAHNLRH